MTRILPALLLLLAACSDSSSPSSSKPADGGSKSLLAQDVAGAAPVLEVLKKAPDAEVAVVGRVREVAKGIFSLVDDKYDYCGRGADKMENCPTPWDYCCIDQEEIAAATIVVKAQKPDGTAVAKADMGVRPLDLVAVKGRLVKEADGSLVVVAKDGWYRRERPKVPDNVKFD